jgi:crotonobetainyl-CoA:carnitine CoA-transferase CaiB-like acyl-CoA transferase
MDDSTPPLPLAGIRVVEMATLVMGPIAGQTLGDYGAEVIKLETPTGDIFRQNAPARSPDMGATFLQFNRNKLSLAVDVKSARGRDLVGRLLATADVFLTNTRAQALAKLGLDYETLRATNPGLIYCAAYGFSEDGPYAGRPAADDTIQAMSGLVDLQARATGTPGFVATVIADKAIGLTVVNAVMAALIRRGRDRTGQFIEVPMFESMVAFVMPEHMAGHSFDPPMGPSGYARIINPNRRPYATADGLLCVLPYTTDQWVRFFTMIGRDDLVSDPALRSAEGRSRRFDELYAMISDVMPERTTAEWVALLLEQDILFGEVNPTDDLRTDPHLVARSMFRTVDHPTEGRLTLLGYPIRSSHPSMALRLMPPRLGEHSAEIAASLGLSTDHVRAMFDAGELCSVVQQPA